MDMKVVYGPRGAPREKRGRGPGASIPSLKGVDEPVLKKSKNSDPETGLSRLSKALAELHAGQRGPWPPGFANFTRNEQ